MVHAGKQQYASILGTDDADLSRFRDSGGKMISFHGLVSSSCSTSDGTPCVCVFTTLLMWRLFVLQADQAIPPKGTKHYYQAVTATLSNVESFYRHFEVPGLGHCFGGRSASPTTLFDQLRAWVENGTAPEYVPVEVKRLDKEVEKRILCPYPQRAEREPMTNGTCGAATVDCWSCVGSPRRSLGTVTKEEL